MSNEYTFTFPPKLGGGNVVMRQLKVGELEDIMARELARSKEPGAMSFVAAQTASVQAAIVSYVGAPWPRGTEGEKRWRELNPKIKTLIQAGYNSIHNTTDDEETDFLATMDAGYPLQT